MVLRDQISGAPLADTLAHRREERAEDVAFAGLRPGRGGAATREAGEEAEELDLGDEALGEGGRGMLRRWAEDEDW